MEKIMQALADLEQARVEKELAEMVEKQRDLVAGTLSTYMDKGMAYTNLLMVAGYAGAFTVWSFTKDELPRRAEVAVALLLTMSLVGFVSYEVYKMVYAFIEAAPQRSLVNTSMPPKEWIDEWNKLVAKSNRAKVGNQTTIWIVQLSLTSLTGFGAMAILMFNFLAILFGWPGWPGHP